jgi:hypothetical protein
MGVFAAKSQTASRVSHLQRSFFEKTLAFFSEYGILVFVLTAQAVANDSED